MPRNSSGNYGGSAKPTIKSTALPNGSSSVLKGQTVSDLGMSQGHKEGTVPLGNTGGRGGNGK